jgi:hypothetical protein
MKKIKIIAVVLALCVCGVLAGCSGYSKVDVKNPQTDFSYTVRSNGGSAVQYGKYVYFINGTRGYDDEDGSKNKWGDVVKGGIYRTELLGGKAGGSQTAASEWELETDLEKRTSKISELIYDFKFDDSGETRNYDDEPIDAFDSVLIAPTTVGTSGYKNGGIFIYDDYIYFATPSNQKGKDGKYQPDRTAFFKMSLDGQTVKRIYTTEGSSASSPYAFYKMGSSVYLVCAFSRSDGKNNIVSVRTEGKKIYDPVYLSQKATSVVLPVKDTYSKFDKSVSLDDFVFYTRDNGETSDFFVSGNAVVACRPDGSEGVIAVQTGGSTSIESVNDGLLFYTAQNMQNETIVRYTNLHDALMQSDSNGGANSYKSYVTSGSVVIGDQSGKAVEFNYSDYTAKYYFRGGKDMSSNGAYMLGARSDGLYIVSAVDHKYQSAVKVYSGSVSEILMTDDDFYAYFLDGGRIYRTGMFTAEENKAEESKKIAVTDEGVSVITAGITADIVANHVMFFASYDQWTEAGTGYSRFQSLSDGSTSFFIGTLASKDKPTEEQLEEYLDSKK